MNPDTLYDHKLKSLIQQFEDIEQKYPGPVAHSIQFGKDSSLPHILFTAIVHGDEIGSLPAILNIINSLIAGKIQYHGRVTFILGNVQASLQKTRFIEEDLNRAFDITQTKNLTLEKKRALEIIPVLQSCDLLFDFHQTKMKTLYPFYAFGFHEESYHWARLAGVTPMFVTRRANQKFSAAGLCIDEFVRLRGKPAVTLELSQRGFNAQAEIYTELVIKRIFKAAHKLANNKITLEKLAKRNRDLTFLMTSYKEPFSHPQKYLKEDITNFTFISQKECIGFDEHSNSILSPDSGYIMFPKYPKRDAVGNSLEAQTELYILVKKTSPVFCQK